MLLQFWLFLPKKAKKCPPIKRKSEIGGHFNIIFWVDPIRNFLSIVFGIFPIRQNEDKDQRTDKQHARIEEVCHDFKGGELISQFMHRGNRHEHLRAVRQDALWDAIGGINKDNISQLEGLGLDGVAVVSAIFAADDISSAVIDLKAKAEKVAESSVK